MNLIHDRNKLLHQDLTYKIIGAAMEVHRELGHGFLEAVYHEALSIEFTNRRIPYQSKKTLPITYKENLLKKSYESDFICYDKVLVEIKALSVISNEHYSQIINYLKITGLKVGLVINFGTASLSYKRVIL